jgi:hypothetical protein
MPRLQPPEPPPAARQGWLRRVLYDQWVIAVFAPLLTAGLIALAGYVLVAGHFPFSGGHGRQRTGYYAADFGGGSAIALGKVRITVRRVGQAPSPHVDYAVELIGEALPLLTKRGQLPGDYVDYDGYRIELWRVELPRRAVFAVTRR